jgi:hypothetical protein
MAWNPAPEVAVARDAANRLGALSKTTVNEIVVLYITADGNLGLSTYGKDVTKCKDAKWLGEKLFQKTMEIWEDYR